MQLLNKRLDTSTIDETRRVSTEQMWYSALSLARMGLITALALNYLGQPELVTRFAKGPLFMRGAYRGGLIAGIVILPAMIGGLAALDLCQGRGEASLKICSDVLAPRKKSQLTVWTASRTVLIKVASLGVIITLTGLLMRVRFLRKTSSACVGVWQGAALPAALIMMTVRLFRPQIRDLTLASGGGQ